MGRRTAVVLPNLQRSSTVYDAVGNVSRATDFNGETIVYGYDPLNRLTFIDLPNDADVSFSYTPTGLRESVTDSRGVTSYEYDERNRLIGRTDAGKPYLTSGATIEYGYDDAGNRTVVRTPGGEVRYEFDFMNRLDKVVADGGETVYEYDAVGNLVKTVLPNGVVESRSYDELNRLEFLENKSGDAVVSSYDYELDDVGNRVAVTEHDGRRVEYVYDSLYRLVSEEVVGEGTTGYVYDDVGNRLQKVDSVEGTTTYTYDDNDRLRSESSGGEVVVYSYDDNGNTISRTSGGEETVYVWDDRNRLVEVRFADGKVVGYGYDDGNIRVSEVVDGVETRFLLDKNRAYAQVLEEYVDGALDAEYVYGNDLISQTRGGVDSFYLVDGLGSVRGLTDASGGVVADYSYDAFGNLVGSSGDVENDYLFAGEQFDGELGQYYLRQRFYDSGTGRFTRRDVYEGELNQPITLHKYLYTGGNPVNFIDPSGLAIQKYDNIVALAIHNTLVGFKQAVPFAAASLYLEYDVGLISIPQTPIISGAVSTDLLLNPQPDVLAAFVDLTRQRIINGSFPPHIPELRTGITSDDGVITRFDAGGQTFYGYNSRFRHLSGGDTLAVNEFIDSNFRFPSGRGPTYAFAHHAEGHAFIQAYRANALSGDAKLFIDAEMCSYCRTGVNQMFLRSGLKSLEVYELTAQMWVKRTVFEK
jgi:RHS repeat-associated protein